MKRLLPCLMVCCLLCACGEAAPFTTGPQDYLTIPSDAPVTTAVTGVTEPLEPVTEPQQEPEDDALVPVLDFIPDMRVDLKYATTDNFTGQVIYDFDTVYLRYGSVKKLIAVQNELRESGLSMKIWDGFRPTSAQFKLWEVCPDPTYVADPNKGFSSHSRGNTVDITLTDADGNELVMPTGFDDFTKLADRDYSDCSNEAAINARYLEELMEKHGFSGYRGEWWHFTDTDSYEVEKEFVPE